MTPFDQARPHLEAAIRRTPLPDAVKPSIFDLEQMVRAGEARLWLGANSAALTEVVTELEVKAHHRASLAGGSLPELLEMCRRAEQVGRHMGLDQMIIEGARPGWARVLAPEGYTAMTRLVKDLV